KDEVKEENGPRVALAHFYCSKGFNVVIARAKITEDARRYPEQDAGAQRYATEVTVACERDQWGRAIVGHVNVAPVT
ncbi:hypothetical protein Tco_1443749, partial [Tanacetum coccineum]